MNPRVTTTAQPERVKSPLLGSEAGSAISPGEGRGSEPPLAGGEGWVSEEEDDTFAPPRAHAVEVLRGERCFRQSGGG